MLQRNSWTSRWLAALVAAWFGIAFAAPADDLREAQRLYSQGKQAPALEKVEAFLKVQPRDPQGRFLKGLILTEQKRTAEAIQVFTGLTEDFPELPEPYNNLAVLYASQGNYDKAKSALELAIHTHPSYATAHENLGDIYAQLASRAYDRALQLDKNNSTAQTKLAMVKDLFSSQRTAGSTKPAASSAAPTSAPPAPSEAPKKAEPPKAEPPKVAEAKPVAPKAAEPKPAAPKVEPKVEPPKAEPKAEPKAASTPAPSSGGDEKANITAAIEGWARAWSAQDVKGYLAAYAPEFEVPGGETRGQWEKARAERIEKPKSIEVSVKVSSVQVSGNEATAVVRQQYKSDALKNTTTKTLKLVRSGDRWLIKQEKVGG
jgi:tetratricopeptide (TPR) repeat protein